jgi:glycosyltransferase involved in cell wall biosynthesis
MAAYNEARVIAGVIHDVRSVARQVVVVDDGSRDATGEMSARAGAIVVKHPINLGQGAALQTAIDFALHHEAEIIVTFDADGQHRAADITGLVEALASTGADFALGSRFLGHSVNLPASRLLLLKAAVRFTRLTTGLQLTDSHNGLRAMTRRGASHIQLRQNRMAHASEILHQIGKSGLKYVEVPVTVHYSAYSLAKGQTTIDAAMIVLDLFTRRLYR